MSDDGGFFKRETADDRPRPAAPYAWIIDQAPIDNKPNKGDAIITGPHGLSDEMLDRLNKGEGRAFRMLDADGIIYYQGRLINGDGFEPLDDYGEPNAGCTSIEFQNHDDEWEEL